ncbi:RagB/SusD family nutrient uptake outer membrane protein [Flagellimonas aequoris]|uniref:RagB/SusD family nutrient uptake outer membrane protein n=1 Tax=Flagellimonas aequoris TaxID=2306997 RepID=A0A418N6Y1_9FLAO|nr:RagB/SusD family nutrient uptake outer membrane protein [Allomuricauda aequoris]RIV70638.1 RagB/SusD family nutrient uptake outer membrane protein [Allomuricauda aequoris]TXK02073.1 RagB/SusD family nutrient uptake outer membrane protein [Allomuricauda aequoris]
MKALKLNKIYIWAIALAMVGCTNLEIEQTDSIFADLSGEFNGVDAAGSLTGLYNSVRDQIETQENLYALTEVSTDEFVVPTRGTDWGDNGVWRTLHSHTWSPTHQRVKNVWNDQNKNVYNATTVIDSRSNPTAQQAAEAKFIRAYSMFWLIDMFGQVPFRTPDEGPDVNPTVMTRAEAFDFAVKDLTEAIPDLPSIGPSTDLVGASKAAGMLLLAKFYLNKHIFTGTGTADASDMAQVISLVDDIKAEGFDLQEGYFELFEDSVNDETIWFTTSGVGPNIWNTLHYNQIVPDQAGGWNGFTTIAEFYDLFEGDPNINTPGSGQEERRGFVPTDGTNYGIGNGFLIGQQYDANGNPYKDRTGSPLVFTKELPGLLGNNERTGIRVIKYNPANGAFANHKIVFRYADAHLMKAEATFRSGGDATALINELRTLRGASPIGSVTEQDIIDERGRELYGEQWRRNDLIRFGQFTAPWSYKEVSGDETKNLFPIPATAIISNPNLVQNPGY